MKWCMRCRLELDSKVQKCTSCGYESFWNVLPPEKVESEAWKMRGTQSTQTVDHGPISGVPDVSQNYSSIPKRRRQYSGGERFFAVFLAFALVMWTSGIAIVVNNEQRVKREIEAAKRAEQDAKNQRLNEIQNAWNSSKYANWNTLSDFKYDFDTKGKCKGSRTCAYPVVVSKFNCESVKGTLNWLKSEKVVDSTEFTKSNVYSLIPFKTYLETDVDDVDYVKMSSLQCIGSSY